MNFIFNDNVRILCLSCKVKKVGKLVRFRQKGQKQASFIALHKCCQGCLFRGPREISASFILVCAVYAVHSCRVTEKFIRRLKSLFVLYEKFIRLVRIKQIFIRIAYLYSKCTDCRRNIINHEPYFRSSLRTKIRLRTILGHILVLSAIIEHVAT
jgi:hypothetical protein